MHALLTILVTIMYLSYHPLLLAQQEGEQEVMAEQAVVEAPQTPTASEIQDNVAPTTIEPEQIVVPVEEENPLLEAKAIEEPAGNETSFSDFPPAEEAPQEEKEKSPTLEIKGIDTLDIDEPKGNWLLKRIWWEKGERLYEKIMQIKQEILESRMFFFQKRTELDRTVFDPFYVKAGFGQGELQEVIASLLATIEKMRQDKGSLNEDQRAFIVTLELEQDTLKAIEQKLKTVNAIDNSIDDAVLKLMEQINRAREYERQGWQIFKSITRELSDKRARDLYYTMDTAWRNIEKIDAYIKDQFAPYFNQIIQKAQQLVTEMESAIAALKEKGIDLKTQSQQLIQSSVECSRTSSIEKEKNHEEEVSQSKHSWMSWVYDLFNMIIDSIKYVWNYITSFFMHEAVSDQNSKPSEAA